MKKPVATLTQPLQSTIENMTHAAMVMPPKMKAELAMVVVASSTISS